MEYFGRFYLDKEKDMIVNLYMDDGKLSYVLQTPNHGTGNLITNLARLCGLPITYDAQGLKIIEGTIPCYVDDQNRKVYVFRLGSTKVANIYPNGDIERKASVPAISKTLMSQTKDYRLDYRKTIVKTYILEECKFRTDLHTHMNANLEPDILIALGIFHQIRYPLYYIRKLGLRLSAEQKERLDARREITAKNLTESNLTGRYLDRRIDDNTFINFADLILNNRRNAAYNIPRIRASLAVMKDGQAVFTNLEKVYLYRYVFTKGIPAEDRITPSGRETLPDPDIARTLQRIREDHAGERYADNTLFQDKLLWTARGYQSRGICYAEITDTTLVKRDGAAWMLQQVHEVMPKITEETGVLLRFLAGIRRIPLTIVRDQVTASDYVRENLAVLRAVAPDPYVAGSDIIGEEINDIRELSGLIRELAAIAAEDPSFVIRIHAGENDSLRDNVANSIRCVRDALAPGQPWPKIRIGHGLYTANLKSRKGKALIADILESGAVLEFQITSNVRLNNLSALERHPLKTYLKAGVPCVQGTDGGALYGTDSIDEELSLEKLLDLTREDLMAMRQVEDRIIKESQKAFSAKRKRFEPALAGRSAGEILEQRIENQHEAAACRMETEHRLSGKEALEDQIRELPAEGMPVILAGGSFNSDTHVTRVRQEDRELIDRLLEGADPSRIFFVVGHRLCGQERYLIAKNRSLCKKTNGKQSEDGRKAAQGKFQIYAFVPAEITEKEKKRLQESGLSLRIALESSAMGTYKSFAYEIFKRRESVLIAFDGNSSGANLIQEAKNGRYRCAIYVSSHCRALKSKADSLQGYVTLFDGGEETAEQILKTLPGNSGKQTRRTAR